MDYDVVAKLELGIALNRKVSDQLRDMLSRIGSGDIDCTSFADRADLIHDLDSLLSYLQSQHEYMRRLG